MERSPEAQEATASVRVCGRSERIKRNTFQQKEQLMAHTLELKDLIEAGLHFGHQTKRWNPKMKPYIFDKRNGIHIIDLTQTVDLIDDAVAFLRSVVAEGKKVLFVATKKQAQEVVKEAAQACNQFYMTERWLGGTLTNNQTIRRSVKRMQHIQGLARNNNGVLSAHKQEAAALARELAKLELNLTGIADMDKLPGALFVVDVCREANAVKEAKRLGIPVVAVVDTNADPDPIDYVIPGNDDSVRGIQLIVEKLADVLKDADLEAAKAAAEARAAQDAERAQKSEAEKAARKEAAAARKTTTRKPSARRAAAAAAQEAVAAAKAEAEAEATVDAAVEAATPAPEADAETK